MVEIEVYAAGLRNPDKLMGLTLELDGIPGLRYKIDTNHDIAYLEFTQTPLPLADIRSLFTKLELDPKFVGNVPQEIVSGKKTQRLY